MTSPIMGTPSEDGTDRLNNDPPKPSGIQGEDADSDRSPDLLTLQGKKLAQAVYTLWKNQPKEERARYHAQWQVNEWRRAGRTNVYVQKVKDVSLWKAWTPPFAQGPPVRVMNKADRLCRRLTAIMFADPPAPDPVPSSGEDPAVEAAEFAGRVLQDVQGEKGLDEVRAGRRAFDRACSYGSGYRRYYVDPRGGGLQPVRIMACPTALSADEPFLDPQTGQEYDDDLVTRFVRDDGSLTDDESEAKRDWIPGLKGELLVGTNVRMLPYDADDLWDAEGVVLGVMKSWGELKGMEPDLAKLDDPTKQALFSFRPDKAEELLGFDVGKKRLDPHELEDDNLVAVFTVYYKAGGRYPRGAYVVVLGDQLALEQSEWEGEDSEGRPVALDIPLTQYAQFDNGKHNPHYTALMEILGEGNELRGAQFGHLLSYLDQFTNRKTFVPTNSIYQPQSGQLPQGTVIPINPGGQPIYEEIPGFPPEPMEAFNQVTTEMEDAAGVQQTAQGLDDKDVKSGRHAALVLSQVQAALSDLQQNIIRAYTRACRIQLQLIRAFFDVPRRLAWVGDDGQHKEKWWSGEDLGSTVDVKLKVGTMTMLAPAQKADLAMSYSQAGLFQDDPGQLREVVAGAIGGTLGLQDEPNRARIKRQIAGWTEGPPKGWQPPQPLPSQPIVTGVDASGQPQVQQGAPQPPPQDPHLARIWQPVPTDVLPDVAAIRLDELKRLIASTRYLKWPAEWRAGVDQELSRMLQATGQQPQPTQDPAAQAWQQAVQAVQQEAVKDLEASVAKIIAAQGQPGGVRGQVAAMASPPARSTVTVQRDATGRATHYVKEG